MTKQISLHEKPHKRISTTQNKTDNIVWDIRKEAARHIFWVPIRFDYKTSIYTYFQMIRSAKIIVMALRE